MEKISLPKKIREIASRYGAQEAIKKLAIAQFFQDPSHLLRLHEDLFGKAGLAFPLQQELIKVSIA